MHKILFPEAYNEFIQTAVAHLRAKGECEPIVELCDLPKACKMLSDGEVDGMVTGIDSSSRDVILACRDILGVDGPALAPGEKRTFSSLFVAKMPDGRLFIIGDGATCKNPTEMQLADIVELIYAAAVRILGADTRVAMLSFSTLGSGGSDPSIDKIRDAISLVHSRRPDIDIDGEMQLDAAIDERIGRKKAPESTIAGHANVLIVPDINSGNILYKSMEQFGNAQIAGPILLGFKKPVADLSRGSTVEDIEFTAECLNKLI
jgi:phosphate acetyltransferase